MSGNLLIEFAFNRMFPHDSKDRSRFLRGLPIQVRVEDLADLKRCTLVGMVWPF